MLDHRNPVYQPASICCHRKPNPWLLCPGRSHVVADGARSGLSAGTASRGPTGSGKRTLVPAVRGDPGSVHALTVAACPPPMVDANAASSHNSGLVDPTTGIGDCLDIGIGIEDKDVPPLRGVHRLQPPACGVGRLSPQQAHRFHGPIGEQDVDRPPPHIVGGADRHPHSVPLPSSGSTGRQPSLREGAGADAPVLHRPTTTARVSAAAAIRSLRRFTPEVYDSAPGPAPSLRWRCPGESRALRAVLPTGEGARAKPVGIRRCPATVMPRSGDEPGRLPLGSMTCSRWKGVSCRSRHPAVRRARGGRRMKRLLLAIASLAMVAACSTGEPAATTTADTADDELRPWSPQRPRRPLPHPRRRHRPRPWLQPTSR